MNTTQFNQHQLVTLEPNQRQQLWQHYQQKHQKKRKIDPHLKRELKHGWLMPYLTQCETLLWGRWNYWAQCQQMPSAAYQRLQWEEMLALVEGRKPKLPDFVVEQTLPDEPIPQIEFQHSNQAEHHLQDCLNSIPKHGSWQGWSSWTYVNYFLDWLLFGFGHPGYSTLPDEPSDCQGASMRLYQVFDLSILLFYPYDYFGRILPEICSKTGQQNQGFYPTPFPLSQMLNDIVINDNDSKLNRIKVFNEPCVGSGSLLLPASNNTLCAVGQDIDLTLLKCTLVQFFWYCPWFAHPIWWLADRTDLLLGNSLSQNPPQSINTIHWLKLWHSEQFETNNKQQETKPVQIDNNHEQQLQVNKQSCSQVNAHQSANNNTPKSEQQLSLDFDFETIPEHHLDDSKSQSANRRNNQLDEQLTSEQLQTSYNQTDDFDNNAKRNQTTTDNGHNNKQQTKKQPLSRRRKQESSPVKQINLFDLPE